MFICSHYAASINFMGEKFFVCKHFSLLMSSEFPLKKFLAHSSCPWRELLFYESFFISLISPIIYKHERELGWCHTIWAQQPAKKVTNLLTSIFSWMFLHPFIILTSSCLVLFRFNCNIMTTAQLTYYCQINIHKLFCLSFYSFLRQRSESMSISSLKWEFTKWFC